MFTFDPLHESQNAIIETVAATPDISMADLHDTLKKRYKLTMSLQHLYRLITDMIDAQMLVKSGGKVSLNLMWISYVEFFAQRAKRTTLQHLPNAQDTFLSAGQKRTFTARSPLDLETMWNHILVQLYRMTEVNQLYKYHSHAWWQLSKDAVDLHFYKELKSKGIECHWLFGNDTFLDRMGIESLKSVYSPQIAEDATFPKEGYNLNVYGEYILEAIFPEPVSSQLAETFENVKSDKDFDRDAFLTIFLQDAKCKMSVWRNPKQADLLRTQIMTHVR